MQLSDITALGDGMYELEKGQSDGKLGKDGIAELKFGGIKTGFTPQKLRESRRLVSSKESVT
jgi:hypothetical protein